MLKPVRKRLLTSPRYRWENSMMNHKVIGRAWTGFICLRIGKMAAIVDVVVNLCVS